MCHSLHGVSGDRRPPRCCGVKFSGFTLVLEGRKSNRRRKRGLGLLFSMGKPAVGANQCAWRSAPSQCQDAPLGPWFPCSLRNRFGDQTEEKNEKAGRQKARFHAVVFNFPRFKLPRAALGASWLQRDTDFK